MNPIAEEILMHYGMPRRSGRYPWGSGENPYQHSGDFLSRVDELKSQGMSDTEIAKAMGLTTTQYRTQKSLAKDERRAMDVARAKSLREDGLSLNEIAKEMGFANDSSVRSLLNENSEVRMNQAKTTAEFIKKQIDEKGMIDVGAGVERELGISKEKLNEALYMLEMEGYPSCNNNSISGIDTTLLSGVITQTNRLVSMANGMVGLDTSGMTSFSSALTTLGETGVTGFINAFNNAESKVTAAASSMLSSFINGANAKKSELTTTFTTLVQAVLTAINGKQGEFQTSGSTIMVKFIAGVRSKDSELRTAFTTTLSGSITAIRDYYSQFKSAGSYLVDGFCDGISENTWKAEAKARAMAAAAAEAAEDELDEHSPSKRFYGIGNFAGVGFINALIDNVSKAGKAGREIARSSIDGLNDIISRIADYVDADMDVQPTIRPVLDLSAVEAGTGRLNTLFSRNQALSVSTGMNDRVSEMEVQNGESSPTGNTYQFTQNNYSPKALSRIDIYRQTKNQFSAMKGLVGNT